MNKTVSLISKNFKKINAESIDEYILSGGFEGLKKALSITPTEVIDVVKASGLNGRGGAVYPTGRKWQQSNEVKGDRKIIVCNADEGEPGTFKDRYLLEYDPYRIIEGMTIGAYAVGGTEGYIYIREEYGEQQEIMKTAVENARQSGYLGKGILGSKLNFDIKVVSGAGAYVCGENSTLIESIEGKSGRPRIKPPFIKENGLFNLPTLVNNVETFSVVPVLFTVEAEKYLNCGTPKSRGTKLISLCGNIEKPGVYEIPFGITLREIIYDIGGGIKNNRGLKFIQLGGASGPIIPASKIDVKYCYDELKKSGLSVGSGSVLVVDDTNSIIEYVKSVEDFFLHESCGKCTPCREGNRQLAKLGEKFANKNANLKDLENAKRFAKVMKYCSFCGLGKTAPTLLFSALEYFPQEFYDCIKA